MWKLFRILEEETLIGAPNQEKKLDVVGKKRKCGTQAEGGLVCNLGKGG